MGASKELKYIIAGTGSRSFVPSMAVLMELRDHLEFTHLNHPNLRVMTGMATGFDEFLGWTAVGLQIPFIAAIPTKGYGEHYYDGPASNAPGYGDRPATLGALSALRTRKSLSTAWNLANETTRPQPGNTLSSVPLTRHHQFEALLAEAESVVYVCETLYVHGVHSNFVRNTYLVNNGDEFVVGRPITTGTANCLRQIQAASKPYVILGTVIDKTRIVDSSIAPYTVIAE